jgi:hypothetical protein
MKKPTITPPQQKKALTESNQPTTNVVLFLLLRVRGVSFALKLLHVRVGSRYLSTYNTRCTSSYKILSLLYLFSFLFFFFLIFITALLASFCGRTFLFFFIFIFYFIIIIFNLWAY